ncbi:TIGR02680 family protein [Streptomyces koyangensis]|uniref:TIGR02680 family protein n=1 Tax=Streptomyces koyangensis TaxID=188770 RepID=A0A385D570_9ACTN|nr:TIGR02680 family protein [Streptomyces koyangensis]AXQ53522.1 TIGR02680 family protein [Streptomyces koyangensis]
MSVTEFPQQRVPEESAEAASARPRDAARNRWQPHRVGILNVWRYYDETFTFHQGRLLLRGQNGSGKSKALELLLPFLFDASLRPNRLSTFGGSERTMHWNMLGAGASGKTRVGYVWMEFRRIGDDGATRWFGCGARLHASVHTSTAHAEYFTTSCRIAHPSGVRLVNETGQPLTKAALTDALRDRGEVYPSATDYRTAVRRELFTGMGEQRYESLLSALLQLRQPKLSERLDPSLLSTLLSRALPPLGDGEITELAEGFERLDRQRDHLDGLDAEVTAAENVASRQRAYARRVLRAAAAGLISATTDMDDLTRAARQSGDELAKALAERASTQTLRDERERRAHALDEAVDALRESDAYRQGAELDRLRRECADLAAVAGKRYAAARAAQATAERDRELADRSAGDARVRVEHARATGDEANRAARAAGMESVHREVSTLLAQEPLASPADGRRNGTTRPGPGGVGTSARAAGDEAARRARRLVRGAVAARREQVVRVTEAVEEHDRAVRDRGAAEDRLDTARTRLGEAITQRDTAATAWDDAVAEQADRLLAWAADCTELIVADPGELAAMAAVEADVRGRVDAAARPREEEIATARALVLAAREKMSQERDTLDDEVGGLRGETELPPPVPRTRTTVRTAAAGAPLWRLVAFREGVPAAVQAGVEAALEAAGLLDAWVSASEGIVLPGHDARAEAALAATVAGPSLLDVLRPEDDIPVPADTVSRLLTGIAYGPTLPGGHPAAVSAEGAWRLAPATGTWSKPEPAFIGALAQQRARQRKIAELTELLEEKDTALAALDEQLHELAARSARLKGDLAARPDHREIDERRRGLDRAEDMVAARDGVVRDATGHLGTCERRVAEALRTLSGTAAEHGLPTDRDRLRDLADAADRFRDHADSWVDARLAASGAAEWARRTAAEADRSRRAAEESVGEAADAETKAAGAAARLQAVESTVGEDYRMVLARVEETRAELLRCRAEERRAGKLLVELEGRIGELNATSAQDVRLREEAVAARDSAAHRFRHLRQAGFAEDAGLGPKPDSEDGIKATLEAARGIAAQWPGLPHAPRNLGDAATRLSEAVHEARGHLGVRADLDLEPDDDVQLFTATLDGVRVGAAGLLATLTRERDRSRDDISVAERRLFDQILTGDVRRHLAARIRRAGALVENMNAHLDRVRTASDVGVHLVWDVRPDLPDSTRTARQLLLKDPGRVTEADREALHTFFRGRIEEAKGNDTAGSWEEHLAEVLDYTAWHRFTVRLDRADGNGPRPLTKRLHGALSGGEKAIALHLPLFAAVAAHYEDVPLAPRPILLDEVFVGVDTVNRGQVFALLTALDLDLMITSDHEWGTYRELPGIAVHQLLTDGDDDAVTSVRFVWNGTGMEAG